MSEINYQALREAAEKATKGQWAVEFDDEIYSTDGVNHEQIAMVFSENESRDAAFIAAANPATVLALLDELERNQQYIKRRDQENEDIALTVGKLRVELEAAEKRIAELEAREIKPAKGEVLVVVSGFTGCGKSAIAGEIEIAMKAIGVPVQWTNGDAEKHMTGADWLTAIEMYKPTVRIVEVNVPRVAGICIKGDAGEQNDEKP
ncbi:TPA: ead/Ea22-like family protein [Escherichia coli]|uniref:Ead/Ea22-like family protein n=1 Tax=Escherichia coli TaxID=562 RepID=A0A8H9T9N5_ECOLX|nr:ead/Ea22-like family protein [Escherichia coli]HBB1576366.1 ead/Ea22-like family protein [Escherichia coli]HBH4619809.1 ead/Ea22-like family protein [Escherichia coli]HDK8907585.1 ead/Ea22-like family protein [Escherichia coli]